MPPRWKGETVCILASGPSLTRDDAVYAKARARTIVINSTWRVLPDADVLYAADAVWWKNDGPALDEFAGERWTQDKGWHRAPPPAPLNCIASRHGSQLSTDPSWIATGYNSAFQAMNLAVLWGVSRIVFLGLDLQYTGARTHHHGDHKPGLRNPTLNALQMFRKAFASAAPQLGSLGVTAVNASRATALSAFPLMRLEDALA